MSKGKIKEKLKGLKGSGLGKVADLGLRVVDKLTTGGLVYNVLDKNDAPEGKLDGWKYTKDLLVWIPLLIALAQIMGWLTPEEGEQLNEALPSGN